MTATTDELVTAADATGGRNIPVRFVGSKGGAGIAQWLISLMPPHTHYVEAFLGRGVVMRRKLEASVNIGIEIDADTLAKFWFGQDGFDHVRLSCNDALTELTLLDLPQSALVYADPPYLGTARKDINRRYYKHDALSNEWHERFLDVMLSLRCMVIVSGYESELYHAKLAGWRTAYKWTVNRAGAAVREFVWMNYQEPSLLHDARFVGDDFTDRQRVKRKMERWKKNFVALPADERWAMFAALASVVDDQMPALLVKDEAEQKQLI